MNKYLYISILLIFIFVISCNAEDNYIIDGNKVYINDENVYLSAYPHTIYESGYVYFNFSSKNYDGNIDTAFGFNTLSVKPKKAELYNSNTNTWVNFPLSFTLLSYSYQNCDKWYYVKDVPIISNKNYKLRIWIETPISTDINKGKYLFAVKPSFETIQQSIDNNRLYVLDPWFDTSFSDRQKIIISTNGSTIPKNYQILLNITYNSNMQNDFDDLRFTNLNNSELNYWIESKINLEYANIWINFSNEIIHPNNDIIYMYYGNPLLSNNSNGNATFINFDIFDNLNNWTVTGSPTLSTIQVYKGVYSILINADQEYISRSPNGIGIYSIMYYDTGDTTMQQVISHSLIVSSIPKTSIFGYLGNYYINNYTYRYDGNYYDTGIIRSIGWHKLKIIMTGSEHKLYIDDILINTQIYDVDTENDNTIVLGDLWTSGGTGNGYWDLYKVRKYITNEPTILFNITEYYTTTLHYNSSSNYNHTIESDGIIIVNRSLSEIDNTYWSAKSLNITYWIFTKEINSSGYTNFTISNDNLNNFTVKLKQYSYYSLNNLSLVNIFNTNQYGIANIDINLIPDDYYINFINQSLIPPPIKPLYPIQGILIFKDNLCINNIDKIVVYNNDTYIGIYNYSDEIIYLDNNSYTFFINYDNIDIINSENFLISFLKNYGYIFISIIGIIIIIGICIYFFNKVRR